MPPALRIVRMLHYLNQLIPPYLQMSLPPWTSDMALSALKIVLVSGTKITAPHLGAFFQKATLESVLMADHARDFVSCRAGSMPNVLPRIAYSVPITMEHAKMKMDYKSASATNVMSRRCIFCMQRT